MGTANIQAVPLCGVLALHARQHVPKSQHVSKLQHNPAVENRRPPTTSRTAAVPAAACAGSAPAPQWGDRPAWAVLAPRPAASVAPPAAPRLVRHCMKSQEGRSSSAATPTMPATRHRSGARIQDSGLTSGPPTFCSAEEKSGAASPKPVAPWLAQAARAVEAPSRRAQQPRDRCSSLPGGRLAYALVRHRMESQEGRSSSVVAPSSQPPGAGRG